MTGTATILQHPRRTIGLLSSQITGDHMRTFLATSAIALGLSACASQAPAPAKPVAAASSQAAAPKAPQCWNGDAGAFMDVGAKASISGVAVVCEKTSDGKTAQCMGAKR